ncbi:MAG: hypothetical protein LLF98_01910 [Clostridium sp.]|uniref:5' nucleotidase, NT5C type n=1 Tax=Clostridium sp. TaxID=1506 RepID=UPI0025C704E8|nr:hypothetical protein [Clostridium sp.]MCE5220036.1 hypothetical protein [Clostridium sp.]
MKQKLFLDFDSVIVDSVTAYTDTYNELYINKKGFIPADPELNKHWDFNEICPLEKNPLNIFSHPLFFKFVEFMPNAENVIQKLNNKYQIIICSLGCYINIARKAKWIKDNMPYIKDAILLTNQGIKMDKGIVNMNYPGSIFIDDVKSNLDSSNAERKILFGSRFDWNSEWTGEWGRDWSEVGERLL